MRRILSIMLEIFPALEDELCLWLPGDKSPNRLDACFVGGTLIETITGPVAIEKTKTRR